MEGYLHKWTNILQGWKERYFILKGNLLYYYLVKGEEARGKFNLSKHTVVTEDNHDDLKFEIKLNNGDAIFLKANTSNERDAWVKSIRQSANEQGDLQLETRFSSSNNNGEEKMLRKILKMKGVFEKLYHNNEKLESVLKKYENPISGEENNFYNEVKSVYEINKINLREMNSSIEEMKANYIYLYNEFSKFAELMLEGSNNIRESNRSKEQELLLLNQNSYGIKTFRTLDSPFKHHNTEIIQEQQEVYYETLEDEVPLERVIIVKEEKVENNEMENFANSFANPNYSQQANNLVQSQANSIFTDPLYSKKRLALPVKKRPFPFNVWQILKDAVGKDLSKFCVPVYFNEPLSYLQRLCENFQYADCLNNAGQDPNPYKRLAYVAGFCLGGYCMHEGRTQKPFNPLLGETYEYVDNQQKFRYFGEQVSHHPPISACFAESDYFTCYANSHAKSKLSIMRGSLEFHPAGRTFVTMKKFNNEIISFTKPRACVRGLIIGKMRVDCYGQILVKNHTTDEFCELEIIEEGIFSSKDKGKVIGGCYDKDKNLRLKVEGNWRTHLDVLLPDKEGMFTIRETIWKKMEIGTEPGKEEDVYFLTDFGINLNNITEELKAVLPHTDSRFRPDQRALEMQNMELAASEKHRLEEKQRARRKEMEKNHETHKPVYFEETYDELNGELIFKYVKDYWKDREQKNFTHLVEIF